MGQHTKTPWTYEYDYATDTGADHAIIGADGSIVTYVDGDGNEANNARRIVAAVNAVEGIPTEALEDGAVDELVASAIAVMTAFGSLEAFLKTSGPSASINAEPSRERWLAALSLLREAIAKAEGR